MLRHHLICNQKPGWRLEYGRNRRFPSPCLGLDREVALWIMCLRQQVPFLAYSWKRNHTSVILTTFSVVSEEHRVEISLVSPSFSFSNGTKSIGNRLLNLYQHGTETIQFFDASQVTVIGFVTSKNLRTGHGCLAWISLISLTALSCSCDHWNSVSFLKNYLIEAVAENRFGTNFAK